MDSGAGIWSGAPPALRCSRGFTLSELMISMVLGLFLVGGVLSVFLSGMETQRLNSATARMQESARFALEVLRRDIRQAGFYGCGSNSVVLNTTSGMGITNTLNVPLSFEFNFTEAVRGFSSPAVGDDAWTPIVTDWELEGPGSLIPDTLTLLAPTRDRQVSDILVLTLAEDNGVQVDKQPGSVPANPASANLQVTPQKGNGLESCDIIMVTDCEKAAIMQISGNPGTSGSLPHATGAVCNPDGPGNSTSNLGGNFYDNPESPGLILRLQRAAYFLADSPLTGRPALFRNDQEIAQDVDSLRFEYGVAMVGDPLRRISDWVAASNVVDATGRSWEDVLAVRATLVLSSGADDNLREEPNTDGVGDDRRTYQTYTTTVGIRNRMLVVDGP